MGEAVIIDALRTPIGRYRGGLSGVRPDDLAAHAIRALLERNPGVDPGAVEDVIFGCANQAGEDNRNVARMALLLAGLPRQVAGSTVNRLCGSGLEAVNQAVAALKMGAGDIFVAGGVESMSRAPLVMLKPEEPFLRGNRTLVDTTLGWRFVNPEMARIHQPIAMGETAENVAEQYGISREEQDVFALESQRKAAAAWEAGRFREEVIPVTVPRRKREPSGWRRMNTFARTPPWRNCPACNRPSGKEEPSPGKRLRHQRRGGGTLNHGRSKGGGTGADPLGPGGLLCRLGM